MKHLVAFIAVLTIGMLSGCTYSLSVEGKQCNSDHRCPKGYACVPSGDDGGSVCMLGSGDGGDGGDGDGGPCVEGAKACDPQDPSVLLKCTSSAWVPSDCGGGNYCFFTNPTGNEVACVADCTTTADCVRDGYYCNQDTHHCEAKGDCDPADYPQCVFQGGADSIKECSEESGLVMETPCGENKYCHDEYIVCLDDCASDTDCENLPDAQNPEPNSCDQLNKKCRRVNLCPDYKTCEGSESCTGGACVLNPTTNADSTGGAPDLQCFKDGALADSGSATECNLEGYVTGLVGSGSLRTSETIGLAVKAYSLTDVLAGDLSTPLDTTTAIGIDNGGTDVGYYQFTNALPTKQELVLKVEAGGTGDLEHVSLYLFGVYLRADTCDAGGGTIDLDIPSLKKNLYATYTEGAQVGINPQKGLILARVLDCSDINRMVHATVGTSLESEATYYLLDDPPWAVGTSATETTQRGFFGAADVVPIRGVISALAKDGSGTILLGTHDIRVFPYSVSVLYFKTPLDPN